MNKKRAKLTERYSQYQSFASLSKKQQQHTQIIGKYMRVWFENTNYLQTEISCLFSIRININKQESPNYQK